MKRLFLKVLVLNLFFSYPQVKAELTTGEQTAIGTVATIIASAAIVLAKNYYYKKTEDFLRGFDQIFSGKGNVQLAIAQTIKENNPQNLSGQELEKYTQKLMSDANDIIKSLRTSMQKDMALLGKGQINSDQFISNTNEALKSNIKSKFGTEDVDFTDVLKRGFGSGALKDLATEKYFSTIELEHPIAMQETAKMEATFLPSRLSQESISLSRSRSYSEKPYFEEFSEPIFHQYDLPTIHQTTTKY